VSGDEATFWTNQVKTASREDGQVSLQPVNFDYKKGWVPSGDAIEGADAKDFRVTGRSSSKYGTTVWMTNDNTGRVIRVKANTRNFNPRAAEQSQANFAEADLWGIVAESRYKPEFTEAGKIKTKSDGQIVWSKEPMTETAKAMAKQNQKDLIIMADYTDFGSTRPSKNTSTTIPNM